MCVLPLLDWSVDLGCFVPQGLYTVNKITPLNGQNQRKFNNRKKKGIAHQTKLIRTS